MAIVIGIAGGSSSGKTRITQKLKSEFHNNVATLTLDNYYYSHSNLGKEERENFNYDHPSAFDFNLLIEHVKALKNHQQIEEPIYDFVIHDRIEQTTPIKPAKVIIVEGILIFYPKELVDLMDIKAFIGVDDDLRFIRRLKRDINERGRDIESVIHQYLTTAKPMHEQFIEPSKKYADIIIPQGADNVVAVSMLIDKIRAILGKDE